MARYTPIERAAVAFTVIKAAALIMVLMIVAAKPTEQMYLGPPGPNERLLIALEQRVKRLQELDRQLKELRDKVIAEEEALAKDLRHWREPPTNPFHHLR